MFNGHGPDAALRPCGPCLSQHFGDMPDRLPDDGPMKTIPKQSWKKNKSRVNSGCKGGSP